MWRPATIAIVLSLSLSAAIASAAQSLNGFDLSEASVPAAEILAGGPPRDGIPAIDEPVFVNASAADFLQDGDRVLGVVRNGIAKAYSIGVLNWHEIVNDRFADEGVVVTFCPLCGTGMAFKSEIQGESRQFGVSGLLYQSDVLLYDRNSESLWSQIARTAVTGPLQGIRLEMVPLAHTSWAEWRSRHPDTLVLSTDTGFQRDYRRDPYAGYATSEQLIFPAGELDRRFHPKELVIGLELGDTFKAYPLVELNSAALTHFDDTVAGQHIRVEYDAEHKTGRVLDRSGAEIPTVIAFWFAWSAFHPDAEVFQANP